MDPGRLLDRMDVSIHKLCRNCNRLPTVIDKVLCARCDAIPSIRAEYKHKQPCEYARDGREKREKECRPLDPRGGTEHYPGTYGKFLVLCDRRQRGYDLWHPEDAGMINYYMKIAASVDESDTPVLIAF